MPNDRSSITSRSIRDRLLPVVLYLLITLPIYYQLVLRLQPYTRLNVRALGFLVVLAPVWALGLGASLATLVAVHLTNPLLDDALGRPSSLLGVEGLPFLVVSVAMAVLIRRLQILGERVKQGQSERQRYETQARESEAQARESEACYRQMFEDNPHPMLILDEVTQKLLAVNAAAVAQYGYGPEELRSMTLADLAPPEDRRRPDDPRNDDGPGAAGSGPTRHRRSDGTVIDVEVTTHDFPFGGKRSRLALVRDITERIRAQEALEHQALHDALTGLPNRVLLRRQAERAIAIAQDADEPFALLMIDLDRFKQINDTLGHHHGDVVLQVVGRRLRHAMRDSDVTARLGGDEFAILLAGVTEAEATAVAGRLLESLSQPITLDGQTVDVGASIGVAVFPEHGRDYDELLRHADAAMYTVKHTGGGVEAYTSDCDRCWARRPSMEGELQRGIEDGELVLHYQPKLDLRTRRIHDAEALVRWRHPREGLLLPAQFLPLARRSGLLKSLSLWSLKAAVGQTRVWQRSGLNLVVSVNLPASSVQDLGLVPAIRDLLDRCDALASWLTIEITETVMMEDPGRARLVLGQLHDLGIKIAVDNFGTGHSSLVYLKDLPIDELKIDRSFIKDLEVDPTTSAIVQSTLELGRRLGVRVVAEGVETQQTLDRLAAMGCDAAQGFLISRPLPADELTARIGRPSRGRDLFATPPIPSRRAEPMPTPGEGHAGLSPEIPALTSPTSQDGLASG